MKLLVSQLRDYLHQVDSENLELVKTDKTPKRITLQATYSNDIKRYKIWVEVADGKEIETLHVITAKNQDRNFATADAIFSFVKNELGFSVPVSFLNYK